MPRANTTHTVVVIPQCKNRIGIAVQHHFIRVPPSGLGLLRKVFAGNKQAAAIHNHGGAGFANLDLIQIRAEFVERNIGGKHHCMASICLEPQRTGHDKLAGGGEQMRLCPGYLICSGRILVPITRAWVIPLGIFFRFGNFLPVIIPERVVEIGVAVFFNQTHMFLHALLRCPGDEHEMPFIIRQIKGLKLRNLAQHGATVGIENLVFHLRGGMFDHARGNQVTRRSR